MIKKILVANRGEIACRVFKTAKSMGIKTVAVYSDADKEALHVSMADEAIYIGASPAAESYLVIDKIIAACKETGADAVHPGYGFLSERAEFCEALAKENITFVGPPVPAIEAMGDKITSKKIAQDAGVSTVPGHMGLIDDAEHAVKIASEIGYPVMIKASAGGGGKGMRIAWDDAEAREGFARSKSEAASSFGDDRIFIEKFVVEPRHIEIQVLADGHGNCIYLNERECSIQRRNQKVIEEAPSPFLDEKTRKAMGEQSCALAKAVGYTSAGTVEFIVDKDRNFYFLEMNTRLQVEHPVTELITGVDLVEQMIRVASGEKLALKQQDVQRNGWSIESRLYAEDPYRGFLPSIGRLTRYRPPAEESSATHAVRNDTGVYEGGEISMFYDPMIAKLCTWAPDREQAIDQMETALDSFEIEGIGHNLPFLSAVMAHDRFRSGNITTAFIEEEYPDGFMGVTPSGDALDVLMASALVLNRMKEQRISERDSTFDVHIPVQQDKVLRIDRQNTPATIAQGEGGFVVGLNGKDLHCDVAYRLGETLMRITIDERTHCVKVERAIGGYRLRMRGADIVVQVLSPRVAELAALMLEKLPPDTSKLLLCPMPGLVVSLLVAEGDHVEEGQSLAIIEAMKMENVLKAEKNGTVTKIPVAEGDSLAVDDIIMEFE
ncbi:acetyl/propionyl-CoA carboxylase subunit alpha [Amylibacter marinus]|uniref:propionyl-CoA carboxylase n=1 Tax=Amylibacter marinus TaxID=1475483 RepID=A0ABQ5VTL2_9RHOB|nr:acetyl/propionyl/methylcrotonyl-CoA carboxylase subunit alpha [Amylibacter marinus]GLQ34453.1 acetyl/propionyl-CoA carboxylase subunit alpha [Amylibacter marinus]